MGFGDRSEVCNNDPFVDQTYPAATIAQIRQESCGPATAAAATREANLAYNLPRMIAAGARLVLGTDAGIAPRHTFGWADHHELTRWVELGVAPSAAIVAATSRAAELLGASDMGVLAQGKRANFVVLEADPIADIHNSRRISAVYLAGERLDRERLLAKWKQADANRR
jgi:imidazolonepropionase-like amidohydrolase